MIEAKAFPLFKGEGLSANIKISVHKALIRSAMAYDCPVREFSAVTDILKL
jgi:hypothetical protein